MSDGRFLGLLVKDMFAQRFIDPDPNQRKIIEVRTSVVKFIAAGEKLALVSTMRNGRDVSKRKILAILEYQACIQYPTSDFGRYFGLHRVTDQEFKDYAQPSLNNLTSWYGYHFRLVHIFEPPIELHLKTGERWIWFSAETCFPDSSLKRPSTFNLEDQQPLSKSHRTEGAEANAESMAGEGVEENVAIPDDLDIQDDGKDQELTCLQLLPREWAAITSEVSDSILRPFRSTSAELYVLVDGDQGPQMVGHVVVDDSSCEVESWTSSLMMNLQREVYSKEQIATMKGHKTAWLWHFQAVDIYENPHVVRFLDMAPRFRNRPFMVSQSQLQCEALNKVPRKMDLVDTAEFFIGLLGEDRMKLLQQTVRHLSQKSAKIRVGTTCSGADICVKALQSTVNYLNSVQAECGMLWCELFREAIYSYL